MRKPKVVCFRYKRYNDVYVSNVPFLNDILISMLDAFLDRKIIVMIESDENYIKTLSSISQNIEISEIMPRLYASRFSAVCNKNDLICLIKQVNVKNLSGMFTANVNNDIITDEFIYAFDRIAGDVVKDGMSDVSISIDFPENQIVISLSKEKYMSMSIKEKICNMF